MDLRQLRYYKEIVEQKSISKAAEQLNIAQPPLSMLLKQLETQYGQPLIKRYREKWEVTQLGQFVYEHAVQMLTLSETFEQRIHYMNQGEFGHLRLGISSSCVHLIGHLLRDFSTNFPTIQLKITNGASEHIQQLLLENELDLAIILHPDKRTPLEIIELPISPFALAIPINWSATFTKHNWQQQMQQYPFISLEAMDGYSMHESIFSYLKKQHITLTINATCKDISIAKRLVAEEVGMSILPKNDTIHSEAIAYFPLPDFELNIKPVVCFKTEATTSKLVMHFIASLKKHFQ